MTTGIGNEKRRVCALLSIGFAVLVMPVGIRVDSSDFAGEDPLTSPPFSSQGQIQAIACLAAARVSCRRSMQAACVPTPPIAFEGCPTSPE